MRGLELLPAHHGVDVARPCDRAQQPWLRAAHVRALARDAQQRLARFSGLHMTPLRWLHVTVFLAGSAAGITEGSMNEMLGRARLLLSGTAPVTVTLRRVLYHPEGIALGVSPAGALSPVLEAAQAATREVTGVAAQSPASSWLRHRTTGLRAGRRTPGPTRPGPVT